MVSHLKKKKNKQVCKMISVLHAKNYVIDILIVSNKN